MNRPTAQTLHVAPHQSNLTLIAALRQLLPGESWSQIRRRLKAPQVQVNGNLCLDEARRLKSGDVVKVLPHSVAPPPREADVKIRYLDAQIVIVEKPAGMTSIRHAEERFWPERRKQAQPTLDEVLPSVIAHKDGRKSRKGARLPRVRAVHRLDRDTSGLMVFARTPEAELHLVQQFRKHTIHRAYIAIAHGQIEPQTITSHLVRDRGDGRRGSTTLKDVGQRAVTHLRPIEELAGYTVVECRLETGRTHQIRIHLSEKGHLICGEKMYHQPLFGPPVQDPSGAPRVALHAAELGLKHPVTGEHLHFKMPLPRDLAEFLNRLRQKSRQASSDSET